MRDISQRMLNEYNTFHQQLRLLLAEMRSALETTAASAARIRKQLPSLVGTDHKINTPQNRDQITF
jgi:hypothetical protein